MLDYLVTLRQLVSLLQNGDIEGFHNKSKIEAIVEGAPSKNITQEHMNAIRSKLRAIKIIWSLVISFLAYNIILHAYNIIFTFNPIKHKLSHPFLKSASLNAILTVISSSSNFIMILSLIYSLSVGACFFCSSMSFNRIFKRAISVSHSWSNSLSDCHTFCCYL